MTRIVADQVVSPAFGGAQFGNVGQYETIAGRVYGELDPNAPLNKVIQDIELAATNARGLVEYLATFFLVKPIDLSRSSGLMWHYAPNRGSGALAFMDDDSFDVLFSPRGRERGDIWLSSGWQGDNTGGTRQVRGREWVRVPIARNPDGSAVTGKVLARFVPTTHSVSSSLQLLGPVTYKPATLDPSQASLTIIETEKPTGEPDVTRRVPGDKWAWARGTENEPFSGIPSPWYLAVTDGVESNKVYEVVYTAQDPPVLGIGFAAFRDVASFFKNREEDDAGSPNPVCGNVRWTIAYGSSQSGNMLRQYLHLGFNQDLANRKVHDGLWIRIATRRIALNHRFAMPNGALRPYELGIEGPQWWSNWPDQVRGLPTGGVLDRCERTDTSPKIVETYGSAELWSLKLSLEWVGTDLRQDIPLPPSVYRYYIPGISHGGGSGSFGLQPEPPPTCPTSGAPALLAANPVSHKHTYSAIESHLRDWVMRDAAPPPSVWPRLRDDALVEPAAAAMGFPRIPGLPEDAPTGLINEILDYDLGPEFNYSDGTGRVTVVPPRVKQVIPSLVPRVNEDGNELGGVPVVFNDAALGTYLGWNIVTTGTRSGRGCDLTGGMVPFATTRAERIASGDPRPSLEERYGNHAGWVEAIKRAAAKAMREGFLLPQDAQSLIQEAQAAQDGWPSPPESD